MTQSSYVWDGVVTGDHGPYDKTYFQKLFNHTLAGNYYPTGDSNPEYIGYVVPNYLNHLKVTSGGITISAVTIDTGMALVNGYVYILDQKKTLTIDRPVTYARFDLVVLELNTNTQVVRLKIVKGTEAAIPLNPALTQTATVWQVPLAEVYVDTTIDYIADIADRRTFLHDKRLKYPHTNRNLLKNSEFMAFSGEQTGASNDYPEGWDVIGSPTVMQSTTKSIYNPRGRAVLIYLGGLSQTFNINPKTKHFTIKGYLLRHSIAAGTDCYCTYQLENSVTGAVRSETVTQKHSLENDVLIHINISDDEEYDRLLFYFSTYYRMTVYPFIITEGYDTGPYRPFSEIIPFRQGVTDAAWTATAKSSGTTTVVLNGAGSFGDVVLPGTKFVILRVRARDSGSAGAPTVSIAVEGQAAPLNTIYGEMICGGLPNDYWNEQQIIVPINQEWWNVRTSIPQLRLVVIASGAGTLDATVEVVGIII